MSEETLPVEEKQKRRFPYKRIILTLVILSSVMIVSLTLAAGQSNFLMPNSATPKQPAPELVVKLDGITWANGTTINWGNVNPDTTYTKTLIVQNLSPQTITATFQTTNLPTGWTQTWSASGTPITSGNQASGTLTLTTPATFPDETTKTWNTNIQATTTS